VLEGPSVGRRSVLFRQRARSRYRSQSIVRGFLRGPARHGTQQRVCRLRRSRSPPFMGRAT
jgi:hypothetical protein